jgi:hypothetical protein
LAKIEIETLPLVRRDSTRAFGEVVLKAQEAVQETFELMKLANVYAVSELVEKFDERSKPLDGGFDLGLEDLGTIFALYFLEVDKNRLRSNESSRGGRGRREAIGERDG